MEKTALPLQMETQSFALCWKLVKKTVILAFSVLQQRKIKTKVHQPRKINLLQTNES